MRFFSMLLFLLSLAACKTETMHFTAISTHSIDSSRSIDSAQIIKNVRGTDLQHLIIFIPTGLYPNIQQAVDAALKENDADMLINVSAYRRFFWIPYIYGQNKYVVIGDAVRFDKD